jgi:hypothetical protein
MLEPLPAGPLCSTRDERLQSHVTQIGWGFNKGGMSACEVFSKKLYIYQLPTEFILHFSLTLGGLFEVQVGFNACTAFLLGRNRPMPAPRKHARLMPAHGPLEDIAD